MPRVLCPARWATPPGVNPPATAAGARLGAVLIPETRCGPEGSRAEGEPAFSELIKPAQEGAEVCITCHELARGRRGLALRPGVARKAPQARFTHAKHATVLCRATTR
jgi:hypothetical protein